VVEAKFPSVGALEETVLPEPTPYGGTPQGGQRPNTVPPDSLFTLTNAQIEAMSNEEIRRLLEETQGVYLPRDTSRSVLLTKLHQVAVGARDI
jgi:hypothetical protein